MPSQPCPGSAPNGTNGEIHQAIRGSDGPRKITRAILSVFDKSGIVEFAQQLASYEVELLSTGGTAKALRAAGLNVKDVSEHTGFPECLDGRAKTMHPIVAGGLLGVRGNEQHEAEMKEHRMTPIDLVCVNLYPFEQAVKQGADLRTAMENVDIGGPTMLRSAAKNNAAVLAVTEPEQYAEVLETMKANGGESTPELRVRFAAKAFALTAKYDAAISQYFAEQHQVYDIPRTVTFTPVLALKYGCNPNQQPAALCSLNGSPLPFSVKNGTPGYINLLDALNAWQLVRELRQALGVPCATSFKHVSPSGCAIAQELSDLERKVFDMGDKTLSPMATAYVRARNADPLCSFGDFCALSDIVDEETAQFLKTEVSDGIIAPGYDPKALEILSLKKGGNFVVLEAAADFQHSAFDFRDCHGAGFMQRRYLPFDASKLDNVVSRRKNLSQKAKQDLTIASICCKFTQSNSVVYAREGQVVGVGAGQQSRVDCVKLAGRKVETWYLRQHPKVMALPFKDGVKRQDRVNARVRYIEGGFTPVELESFNALFDSIPPPLTQEEKTAFLATLNGISLSSDAFFPFRDNIDHAAKFGVEHLAHPGGSVQDEEVCKAADSYNMTVSVTGQRLFHH